MTRVHDGSPLRVLAVIPGSEDDPQTMIFARRQIDALERAGVTIRRFWLTSRSSPPALVASYLRLRREIAAFDPDIVHAHFGTMTSFLCALGSNRPMVITFRGSDLHRGAGVSPLRRSAGRLMSQISALRAQAVICVSTPLSHLLWRRPTIGAVIPSGVDFEQFLLLPRAEARRRLGWSPDQPVVLFNAGRNPAVKRLDLAEAAAGCAARLVPDLRLHVISGDTAPDEMVYYYNAADCLLVTSDNEGSPNVVKEALACNLPVVSVDVGDVVERLRGVEPSVVTERDPVALGGAVAELVTRRERSNGRVIAEPLSSELLAERVVDLYRQVLAARCRARGPV